MTSSVVVETPAVGTYRIEADGSEITFATRHMFGLGAVRGTFGLRSGLIEVAEPLAKSTVRAVIAADEFHTGLSARDNVVRSRQYLDTANHPDITFVATGVAHDEGWVLRGTLIVRGRTEPLDVAIDEVRVVGDRLQLRASATVDRYAWGLTGQKGMTGRRLQLRLALVASATDSIA